MSDPDSIEEFAAGAENELGPIEVVVSSAGDVLPASTIGTDHPTFVRQVQVNLLGVHRLLATVLPGMVDRQRGDVVLISSDVVHRPRPNMSSYVTSKWGLEGLVHAMQMEMEGTGVRVSTVRPGPTASGMGSELGHGHRRPPARGVAPVGPDASRRLPHGGRSRFGSVGDRDGTAGYAPRSHRRRSGSSGPPGLAANSGRHGQGRHNHEGVQAMGSVGFIGLGSIGSLMARHVLGWADGLVVYDVRPEATGPFGDAGATVADVRRRGRLALRGDLRDGAR